MIMSLINHMLKDLQQHDQTLAVSQNMLNDMPLIKRSQNGYQKIIFSTVITSMIMIFTIVAYASIATDSQSMDIKKSALIPLKIEKNKVASQNPTANNPQHAQYVDHFINTMVTEGKTQLATLLSLSEFNSIPIVKKERLQQHKAAVINRAIKQKKEISKEKLRPVKQVKHKINMEKPKHHKIAQPSVVKSISKTSKNETVSQYYVQAKHAMKQFQTTTAIQLLEQALILDPQHHACRQLLVSLFRKQNNDKALIKVLIDGIDHESDNMVYLKLLAKQWIAADRTEDAIHLLETKAVQNQKDGEYYAFLAALYQRQHHHDKAVKFYYRALQFNRNMSKWWLGLAISQEQKRQFVPALQSYRQASQNSTLKPSVLAYTKNRIEQIKQYQQ